MGTHDRASARATGTGAGQTHSVDGRTGTTVRVAIATLMGEIDQLTVPDHIAPGAETISIGYHIADPGHVITDGKIEIKRLGDDHLITTRALTAAELSDGAHTISWDGAFFPGTPADPSFPGGYVNVANSPYVLHLSVTSNHSHTSQGDAKAQFQVEVAQPIVLELGPANLVQVGGPNNDRWGWAVHELGSLNHPGDPPKKILLKSNLFYLSDAEQHDASSTPPSFVQHRSDTWFGWGDGPRLPILASVKFVSSTGDALLAPKAWGNQRVFWSVADITRESVPDGGAADFVRNAMQYRTMTTIPSGTACHEQRGGKRSSAGSPRLFPTDMQHFPFTLEAAPAPRAWGVFSSVAAAGGFAGKTGVVFSPSRMAGDTYAIVARFHPTAARGSEMSAGYIEVSTGPLQVWRRVEVQLHWKKRDDSTASEEHPNMGDNGAPSRLYPMGHIDWDAVKRFYEPACIQIDTSNMRTVTGDAASYDRAFAAAAAVHIPEDDVRNALFGPAGSSMWAQGHYAAFFRDPDPSTGVSVSRIQSVMIAHEQDEGVAHDNMDRHFEDVARDIALDLVQNLDGQTGVSGGVHVFQFSYFENQTTGDFWKGWTPATGNRYQARVLLCGPTAGLAGTAAHEIGHALFLSHAPYGSAAAPDANLHTTGDSHCLMGYADGADHFCGMCSLKLRGWAYGSLHADGHNDATG